MHQSVNRSPNITATPQTVYIVSPSLHRHDETSVHVHYVFPYASSRCTVYVAKEGHTADFLLSERRDMAAAERFLQQVIEKRGVPLPSIANLRHDPVIYR